MGYTLIFDVGVISGVIGSVSDNLDPTIRQSHPVFARSDVSVPRLSMREVLAGVLIIDGVTKSVVGGSLQKCWKIFFGYAR